MLQHREPQIISYIYVYVNTHTTVTKISPIVTSFYHNSNYLSDQSIADQMELIKKANIYSIEIIDVLSFLAQ